MTAPVLSGLCSVTFRSLTADRVIDLAVAAGLHGIEWGADVHVPPGALTNAHRTADACRDAGLAIPSYGTYIRAGAADPQQEVGPVLDTAAALGAANIRVWAGDTGSAASTADQRRRVADAVRNCAGAAASRGITVSLEYHRNTLTDTLASTKDLLAAIGHHNCFAYWQPVPEIATHDAVAEVGQLAPNLSHVHVFHWHAGNVRQPLAPAEPFWRAVIAAIESGAWSAPRYAFLEFVRDDDPDQFLSDAAVLKRILAGSAAARSQPSPETNAAIGAN